MEQAPPSTLEKMRASFNDAELFSPSDSVDSVESLLRKRIENLISLPKSTTVYSSFRELVLAFEADWRVLLECRNDWMRLLETVIQINSENSSDVPESTSYAAATGAKQVADKWRTELLAGFAWPPSINSQLEAKLSHLPIPESKRILSDNIVQTVEAMSKHMAFQLNALVERCVLGKIEWYGVEACQFSFIDRSLHSSIRTVAPLNEVLAIERMRRVTRRNQRATGSVAKTIAVHVHDLIDVVSSAVDLAMAEIPEHVHQVIDAVPRFLQGDLKLVEGNLIRARCIEHNIGTEEWDVTEDFIVTQPLDTSLLEPVMVASMIASVVIIDPAIVLADRYVLIGWLAQPKDEKTLAANSLSSAVQRAVNRFFK
ncbi:hypothetical protein [Gimesia maris]|uniref:hypothetical protein n=1 Tax=Gimesia maris TaxID=122 RepID=UPI003A958D60